jgi:O-antigen biosynthesis protein
LSRLRKALFILRNQGPAVLLRRISDRMARLTTQAPSLVHYADALAVDWSTPHPAVASPARVAAGPLTVAWIMSPPGQASGGHQNLYRFISYMEGAGHRVKIYLYSVSDHIAVADVKKMTAGSSSYPAIKASIEWYSADGVSNDVDAIFATGWETAYPAFRDSSLARRFYFVQDFEPYFYPVGTDSVLAENTYRFGFTGITAGNWLSGKLAAEYGMRTTAFEFGVNRNDYHFVNEGLRKEIFFYARPVTQRRGFELGVMALDLFARERPDYLINLAGWDVSRFRLPFAFRNLGSMAVHELNDVYNRCAAGLVLSMTNMSLLPLELMGAGVIPVVNDGDNNTKVSSNPYIEYSAASPRALADRMIATVDRPDLPSHARAAAASLDDADWSKSGVQFISAFESVMRE